MARVSQIVAPLCVRQGTRKDGDMRRSSPRVEASSVDSIFSSNAKPAILHSSQPRIDQDP